MKLVSVRQEAHHRGYRIEGVKQGEGLLLRVTPTRPDLPTLRYSRFRTLRSTWLKAVGVVVGYIDESLNDTARSFPLVESYGGNVRVQTNEPTDKEQVDESLRVRALLRSELNRLQAGLLSGVGPKPTVLHLVDRTDRLIAPIAHASKERH
jgi:hypothetical protein